MKGESKPPLFVFIIHPTPEKVNVSYLHIHTRVLMTEMEALVRKLLEKVTVYDDYLEFQFKSGVTVSVEK